nr:reverse transcriptase domain-containing protein [Tanacetum cinerariifolium]
MKNSIQASMSNQTNELKNMMASFFQMNTASTLGSGPLSSNTIANPKGELKAITTQSGIVLDGPSVTMPSPFINPKEDERVEETLTDQDLAEYTIKRNSLKITQDFRRFDVQILDLLYYELDPLPYTGRIPFGRDPSYPVMKGLSECKASESNVRRIQFKDMFKEVKDHLNTYSSAEMDISWYVEGIR